jgi:hypothetical protein
MNMIFSKCLTVIRKLTVGYAQQGKRCTCDVNDVALSRTHCRYGNVTMHYWPIYSSQQYKTASFGHRNVTMGHIYIVVELLNISCCCQEYKCRSFFWDVTHSKTAWPFKIKPTGYSETSVTANQRCVTFQYSEGLIYTTSKVWNHAKCPLSQSHCNEIWIFSTDFQRSPW